MKLLITGCASWSLSFLQYLLSKCDDYSFVEDERIPLKEQGINPEKFDTVICNGLFLYNDIKEFTNLKVVQLSSVGYDRVPMDYINEKGIKIFNARGVYSIPMAEYAVFGVMELYKNAKALLKSQENGLWEKQRNIKELFNKTVCIVGAGNVGGEVAKRFSAFGCKIVGVDLFEIKNDVFSQKFLLKDIKKALSVSDIVVLTLPLTNETEKMFNDEMFSAMKEGAVFVNIARGKIVEENALLNAVKNKLFGAVLDVFSEEPLNSESKLWQQKNVIITPHNSFVGEGNIERLEKLVKENIL